MSITGGRLPDSASSGADHVAVRRHNLAVVLRHLRDSGPRSRARVTAETGLNKATVSSLVGELAERGLVRDGEAERGSVGRPGQTVVLDGHGICGIWAEFNVDYVAAMAVDLPGEVGEHPERSDGQEQEGDDPADRPQRLCGGHEPNLLRARTR